jgi:hypothetical protein
MGCFPHQKSIICKSLQICIGTGKFQPLKKLNTTMIAGNHMVGRQCLTVLLTITYSPAYHCSVCHFKLPTDFA